MPDGTDDKRVDPEPEGVPAEPVIPSAEPPGQTGEAAPTVDAEHVTAALEAPATQWAGRDYSAFIGGLFWVIFIAAGAYWALRTASADVLLNVSTGKALVIGGAVSYNGAVVTSGNVYLTVEDGRDGRYLGSAILPVNATGTFGTDPQSFSNLHPDNVENM
jgi:hypothetical protein